MPRTRHFRIGRDCCGTYTGKLAAGAWYYSATFDDLTKVRANGQRARRGGNGGFYLLADQTVYQDTQEPDRHASLFGQFGMSAPSINRFAYYTGAGLTFSAPIAGRNQDEVGIAVAAAHNGSPFIRGQRNQGISQQRSEVAFELTYLAQFGAHLAVQPDLQFVLNPNTNPKIKNALAFFLRFEIAL
jgi:porin